MAVRGIRGAIDVQHNQSGEILAAVTRLLREIVAANSFQPEEVAAVYFTATPDLDAVYPARAAREMGWVDVPLMCAQEMHVPGSLEKCIRVLLLWNTEVSPSQVRHVYLGKAAALRPDWVGRKVSSSFMEGEKK